MYTKPFYDKKGNLISYRLICSGKDPDTNQHKNYTKTWRIPKNLETKKDISKALRKVESDFEEEVEKISIGSAVKDNNVEFEEFAKNWLEEILIKNEESKSFYIRARDNLEVILKFFKKYKLKEITPSITQKFYNELCKRKYTKTTVTVKRSVNEILDESKLSRKQIAKEMNMAKLTLRLAGRVGETINKKTADKICKHFNLQEDKFFNIEKQECYYSKATNNSIKTTLVMILNSAMKLRLVEHNFATSQYTNAMKGTTKEKEIYNEEEAREFVQCALNEKDLRKKTIYLLLIFLGLRKSEVAGLEWQDIDFDKGLISINRNSLYLTNFGVITKSTKTKNSQRTISVPDTLLETLKQYHEYWLEQQKLHGDLWAYTKRLFVQDSGKPINPCSIGQWIGDFEAVNGLKHIPPHQLRHTAITLQILAGVPLKVASERAGHANESITLSIYTHSIKSQDRQASQVYNDFLMQKANNPDNVGC